MTTRVLISFFCDDSPGIIEVLSGVIAEHEGNWLESQLSRLDGRFAGILQAQIPSAHRGALAEAVSNLGSRGITAVLSDAGADAIPILSVHCVTLTGPDRPGIVRELTRALRGAGFNVQSLDTSVESAPMSGELLFRAEARIELFEGSRLHELEEKLEAMAESMTLEIDLIPQS